MAPVGGVVWRGPVVWPRGVVPAGPRWGPMRIPWCGPGVWGPSGIPAGPHGVAVPRWDHMLDDHSPPFPFPPPRTPNLPIICRVVYSVKRPYTLDLFLWPAGCKSMSIS